MKKTILLTGVLLLFYYCQYAQTVKTTTIRKAFGVQVDENTIIRNAAGERISYPEVLKMISAGNYTLDPLRDSNGDVKEYVIRPVNTNDAGKRETVMRTPGTEGFPKPKKGEQIPNFVIYDMKGSPITMEKLKGKITVISFWFSTCKPCLYEMPYINEMAASFANNADVMFIAPSPEPRFTVEKFMEIQPFSYIACPEANSIMDAMNIHVYPTHVIVGRDGRILKSYAGGLPGIEDLLKRDVEAALKGQLTADPQ